MAVWWRNRRLKRDRDRMERRIADLKYPHKDRLDRLLEYEALTYRLMLQAQRQGDLERGAYYYGQLRLCGYLLDPERGKPFWHSEVPSG